MRTQQLTEHAAALLFGLCLAVATLAGSLLMSPLRTLLGMVRILPGVP